MSNLVRPNVAAAAGYIPGEQPTDTSTIKLNTNENPYPPSPKVLEAIRQVTPEQLRRYPNPNARPFREAAAQVHSLPADYLLTFNGGDELLACAIRACAGETDNVAYLDPSYSLYPVLTEMQGSRKVVILYEETANGWRLPQGLEKTDAAIFLIVNPNAPTGHLNSLADLDKIARTFRGVLLLDEAYVDFASHSALPLVAKYPNVLILRTMSKGYGLAGLRFGYAIGQPALLQQIEKVRDSYPCDAISIAAATAAILDQPYARSTWQKIIAERDRLSAELAKLGLTVPDSQSNFLLVRVPPVPASRITAQALYEGLKARGILVRWWDLPRIADKLRITVGTPEQNERLLHELRALLRG